MQLMDCRYVDLKHAMEAAERGAVPLVGYSPAPVADAAGAYIPVGMTDDLGTYYAIPLVARLFRLPIESAIDVFYFGMICLAVVVGVAGVCASFRTWTGRTVAAAWFAYLGWTLCTYCDVYLIAPCCALAFVPWVLVAVNRMVPTPLLLGGGFLLGTVAQIANLMRGHAATPVLLLSLFLMPLAAQYSRRTRIGFFCALALGMCGPVLYQTHLVRQADAFLCEHHPDYVPRAVNAHPFWHSVYIGLGFFRNPYGIEYDDAVGSQTVKRIAPEAGYFSPEYEQALRGEVLDLYRRDSTFIWKTLFAKFGIMLFYLIKFANVGLPAVFLSGMSRRTLVAFIAALGFSSLTGILVMPFENYSLGFITWSGLFGGICAARAIERLETVAVPSLRRLPQRFMPSGRFLVHSNRALRFVIVAVAVALTVKYGKRMCRAVSSDLARTEARLEADRLKQGHADPADSTAHASTESGENLRR